MKKKQRTSRTRALPAAKLDAMHDAGVHLSAHVDLGKAAALAGRFNASMSMSRWICCVRSMKNPVDSA
jgi:hypothetical protein